MSLTIGTLLGPYEILGPIGAGGMGEVYLARDSRLDRKVALKVLPPAFADDPERMSRFVREAKSASALNHPNILTIHEIGESGGYHHITTELIAGETLRDLIVRGPMATGPCLEIGVQIAVALDAAHAVGVIHRDIKPENVMIRADGLVKVLDFGLAKWSEVQTIDLDGETFVPKHTQPGMVMGTVAYMSPEQIRGKAVDARTDIWSLGVVIYEMLAGRPPFDGDSSADVLANVLYREPASLARHRPDVAPELADIVGRSLAKHLPERYPTAGDLMADLRSLQKRLEFHAELKRQSSPDRRSDAPAPIVTLPAPPRSSTRRAIAVLPFTNMSADAENDYFCDGLAEELLNALAKMDGLKVAARTSAFSFKGKNTSISEIGRELGVTAVLEGSVRRSGSRSRIAVQLINAADGYHLWSERFDVEMKDIFDVQDEITLAVVDALKVKLFEDEKAAALKRGTDDPEAYQLYLKGRFCWNKRTALSVKEAAACYAQAIERDPGYALAYSGLAESYVLFSWLSVEPPRECMPKARVAALRALEIDDALAEAHAALGVYLSFFAWDQPASERTLRRAIELAPRSASAHHWLGNTALLAMGRFDESISVLARAGVLDPLSPIIGSDTGVSLFCARRFDEAIQQFQQTLALAPDFYVARYHLGLSLHSKGMYDEAIAEYGKCLASYDDPWVEALLARSLAKAGQREDAVRHRDRLVGQAGRRYVPNVGLAVVHAALGEMDEAMKWLESDFADRSLYPPFYSVDPVFDDLRDSSGFDDLVRRARAARWDSIGGDA
jgi:serine/threonine-protein kinase